MTAFLLTWLALSVLACAGWHLFRRSTLDARLAPHVLTDMECRTCGSPTFRPQCAVWCERIGAGSC